MSRHSDKPWIGLLSWNRPFDHTQWTLYPPEWWIAIHGRFSAPTEVTCARIEYARPRTEYIPYGPHGERLTS